MESMSPREILECGILAFERRECAEALRVVEPLLRDAHDPSGYVLSGLVHEFGGPDFGINLARAISDYTIASVRMDDADVTTLLYLARALLKQGQASHPRALRYIQAARNVSNTAEVDLAFARYHEVAEIDLQRAKSYYIKAALRGRFAGSFGLAHLLRSSGHPVRARLVDVIRILTGPFLLLAVGRKVTSSFDGY